MSQGKVTDFFSTKKRNPGLHASKRRKVEIVATQIDNIRSINKTHVISRNLEQDENQNGPEEKTMFSPLQTRAARKAKINTAGKSQNCASRTRKVKVDSKQKLISQSFPEPEKGEVTVSEAVTSWSDNDGPPTTPQKETVKESTRKRSRQCTSTQEDKAESDEATPGKRQTENTKPIVPAKGRARKKLQMVFFLLLLFSCMY